MPVACFVATTFWLNWRAFGPSVAVWGMIPLTFASTGAIWLSGRITGGHLLTAVWFAAAFGLLAEGWRRGGGWEWAAALGVWVGLGLYIDSMFAAAWVGLGVAVLIGRLVGGRAASIEETGVGELPGVRRWRGGRGGSSIHRDGG